MTDRSRGSAAACVVITLRLGGFQPTCGLADVGHKPEAPAEAHPSLALQACVRRGRHTLRWRFRLVSGLFTAILSKQDRVRAFVPPPTFRPPANTRAADVRAAHAARSRSR